MTFQKTVFMIAVVLFILIMTVVGVLMSKSAAATQFPPEIGNCPDYWELVDEPGDNPQKKVCNNIKELGTCNQNDIDFNAEAYKSRKKKCDWAKGCNIEWDGITNQGLC
tara:strand:- start:218 stop:544 length:327 start_codon:yes stop_codon:yes gene_type:complete